MEEREKEYIVCNLDHLVHLTYCSEDFFQTLVVAQVLSSADVDELVQCRRASGSYAESMLLYRKCMERPKAFDALIKALLESKQTEPMEILMDFYRTNPPTFHPADHD